jgi:predicted Abi (CAAX) family protease
METNKELIMHNEHENMTVAEAKSKLQSLASVEQETDLLLRAPLWLNFIMSFSYGMGLFSWASTRHENLWMLGVIISGVVFIFAVVFYLYRSRLLGIKPKVMPKSRSELVFGFLLAIFFGSVTALTIVFSVNEIWWASYAGGVIAALALGFTMHYYPSGEYKKGKHQND